MDNGKLGHLLMLTHAFHFISNAQYLQMATRRVIRHVTLYYVTLQYDITAMLTMAMKGLVIWDVVEGFTEVFIVILQ